MSAGHTISGLTRAVGTRAVHLRLYPRPESMAESREILRLLQGYGKVEMFKNLKYDALPVPNAMLAIFESEEAARDLLRQSPLRFNMSKDDPIEDGVEGIHTSSAGTEAVQPTSSDRNALAESAARQPSGQSSASYRPVSATREYQLQVNSATMHHRDHINANAYNGPFAVDSKSAIQEDLAKRVPLVGISEVNLRKPEKAWRVLQWEQERERKKRKTLRQILEDGKSNWLEEEPAP